MTNRHYESVVLLNAALEDAQIDESLSKVEEFIKSQGGEISETEKWGRKRLAYPIQKSKTGYYAVYRFTAPSILISDLERNFRLDENIIRYLTIQLDKNAVEYYASVKEKAELEAVTDEVSAVSGPTESDDSTSNDTKE
ncbi:MAG: 30S ribosomal protein S6 [Melioribacteraceae bacterium]|nr:30S ribosomal protein S6 [Melioribacteraceae bacterium]MCF8264037.1 30S ribosomal protein S6 [Melioribacteraceae bacterium]MCF8411849.1 30S ribosomal protein S6 [Melioribacteraceae bacterium]